MEAQKPLEQETPETTPQEAPTATIPQPESTPAVNPEADPIPEEMMQDRSVDGTCDLRRTGMTGGIARVGGESADVGYLLPLVQRQCAQIAQEHTALLGQLDSQTAVCGAAREGRLGRCGQKSAYNVRCSAV